jgi:hypothetical protein
VRGIVAFLIALIVCVSAGPAIAAPPRSPLREGLRFDASSEMALVVFEAEPNRSGVTWRLNMLAFDPETRTWTYGLTRGWSQFEGIRAEASGRQFYAGLVRPGGVYAINGISADAWWNACFNGGSKAFDLQAGAVNYIGVIDPNPTIVEIAQRLPPTTRSQRLFLFDTPRLAYTPASERPNWQADVAAYIADRLPRVNAPIVAPTPIDVTFDRGHSVIAGDICEKY